MNIYIPLVYNSESTSGRFFQTYLMQNKNTIYQITSIWLCLIHFYDALHHKNELAKSSNFDAYVYLGDTQHMNMLILLVMTSRV